MVSFLNKLAGIKEEEVEDVAAVRDESRQGGREAEGVPEGSAKEKDWLDENYEGQL